MTQSIAIRDEAGYLANCDEVMALARQCKTIGDAKNLADRARAAQVWAQRAKLDVEKVGLAAAARLWAERRAGELLIEARDNGERESQGGDRRSESKSQTTTLNDLGVTKHESARYQRIASVPIEEFHAAINEEVPKGKVSYAAIERRVKRKKREDGLRTERAAAVTEARQSARTADMVEAAIQTWRPEGVDAIVTDPPYITADAIDLYSALADFAVDVLPEHGCLATMCWQPILEQVIVAMQRPELAFRWVICWQYDADGNNARTFDMARRVHDGWKPVLVYHKNGWADDCESIYDTIHSPGRVLDGDHVWEQSVSGVERLISYTSTVAQTICDPFMGSGTTGIAALKADRNFVGADIDPDHVATAQHRLATP